MISSDDPSLIPAGTHTPEPIGATAPSPFVEPEPEEPTEEPPAAE